MPDDNFDVIILGAGAAGLMCAISAGRRGKRVLLLDHANRIGKKILMSGGGRCNFTNLNTTPKHFISANPHFCKSALARFTPWHFLAMVDEHAIPWHEKAPGQLFCDRSSKDIVALLAEECNQANVQIRTHAQVQSVQQDEGAFAVTTSIGKWQTERLVVATGGLSIPKMGATGFGYQLARQFGLNVLPTRAGLVPFTLQPDELQRWSVLSGLATDTVTSNADAAQQFHEPMLFTHRGLSGPAMLQISSFWQPGEPVLVNLLPGQNAEQWLQNIRAKRPKLSLQNALAQPLPSRMAEVYATERLPEAVSGSQTLQSLSEKQLLAVAQGLAQCPWYPNGTEGYRTAEVTLGGVDTDEVSSKTFETKNISGLYFVGEALDVTGQLGGFNFQWAWASGWCAGQAV